MGFIELVPQIADVLVFLLEEESQPFDFLGHLGDGGLVGKDLLLLLPDAADLNGNLLFLPPEDAELLVEGG